MTKQERLYLRNSVEQFVITSLRILHGSTGVFSIKQSEIDKAVRKVVKTVKRLKPIGD